MRYASTCAYVHQILELDLELSRRVKQPNHLLSHSLINPLTTDDEYTRHATLAACYQLVQSVLKIGFALAKKVE